MNLKKLTDAAAGRIPCDLAVKNARVVNVFDGTVELGGVGVSDGIICGVGDYDGREVFDAKGAYLVPSFIDAHMHIESTQLSPAELSKLILPRGTTTLVADPHEIANVVGFKGVDYMRGECEGLPIDVNFMLPSCVPATPFEDSGAVIDADALEKNLSRFFGVGEFMNYVGVINADAECLAKLSAAVKADKIVDGHACGVTGKALAAYLVSGIKTDHECTTADEAREKLARGMYVLFRQGSSTRNLLQLLPAINERNSRRCLMCTDDKRISDLETSGHIDNNIRLAIKNGIDPITAIRMATLNPAECYGFKGKGAIAPSYRADMAVVDDLEAFNVTAVFKDGVKVAENGRALFDARAKITPDVLDTVRIKPIEPRELEIRSQSGKALVMSLIPENVVTVKKIRDVKTVGGVIDMSLNPGLNKLAVVERHRASGKIGLGLIDNYGIKNGAAAISVAHDSHNVICVGDNDADMLAAIEELARCGGGATIASGGKALKTLPLKIAGLMSDQPAEIVERVSREAEEIAYSMGVNRNIEPFMSLSFLSLAVIPEIKLTARGLFDVEKFRFVPIDPEA